MKSQFDDQSSIDDIFRNGLKDYHTPAPKGMWAKISSRLSEKARRPFSLPLYIAASVFIAAMLSVGFWSISLHKSDSGKSAKIITSKPSMTAPIASTTTSAKLKTSPASIQTVTTTGYTKGTARQTSLSTDKKINTVAESNTVNYPSVSLTQAPAPSIHSTNEEVNLMPSSPGELNYIIDKPMAALSIPGSENISYDYIRQPKATPAVATLNNKNIKGFYAGVNGSVNNVWIMDRVALHDANFDYQPTLGFTYGVQGGYNFSNNFGLETGLTINARDGQKYITYINAIVPINKSVVLNYTEIPVLAKIKIPQISALTGMPIVLNLNIGASYGYLRSAYTFVEGDRTHSKNQYPTNQVNAIAGFSYDIYTKHPYSFSFGLLGEYGINTTENDNQPSSASPLTTVSSISRYANGSDFSSPHNLSVGITAAINYNFSLFRR